MALMEIRDNRLYREGYTTFEDYCRERWGMERANAYRLIDGARVVGNLSPIGDKQPPANEAQVRPLTRLEPEQQREAWQRAVETAPNERVTAAHVEQVVEAIVPRRPAPEPAPPPEPEPEPEPEDAALFEHVEQVVEAIAPRRPTPPEPAPPLESRRAPEPDYRRDKMAVHHSSASEEHWTPTDIVQAVLEVLGAVDLDPCSNSRTAPNVPAGRHYVQDDDGLEREWSGRVYMNPPYGRQIGLWAEKLVAELEAGRVTEALALVPARTDTQWWKTLEDFPACFIEGRLTFVNNEDPAPFPSAVFYLGPNVERFFDVFSAFGSIWRKMVPGFDFGE